MQTAKSILIFLTSLFLSTAANSQTAQPRLTMPTPAELHAATIPTTDNTWWKHAVFYEIYPRSFQDSNGDGLGDLNGITQRVDYLQSLGVDAIWIAPMYPSPQVDFGYDISDYESVDPPYGTLADFDKLQSAAKQHNIRIILDMVLNHTSDKHKWFIESASSRTNPKADWYVWNDGKPTNARGVTAYQKRFEHEGMVPPNNWESLFGGSAWEWVPARHQFYYHKFYKQQPDLNWRNPAVEKAMFDTMRFWLDRGVAGFRLDAIPTLFEDTQLRDEPLLEGINAQGDPNLDHIYTDNLADVHGVIRRMRAMVNSYSADRVLIGETYLPNTAELDKWYGGPAQNELQLPMDLLVGFRAKFTASEFRSYLTEVQTQIHGSWPLLVFDNHDNPRSWDRFGSLADTPKGKTNIARILATILFTSRASSLMYYGEELGMHTQTPARVEDVRDPIGITGWPKEKGRDGERTPMQWTSAPLAGFSTNPKTWLPIESDSATVNVATETADPHSLLSWYKQLIALRRTNTALHFGGTIMLDTENSNVLSWVRTAPSGAKPVLVSMNFTAQPQTIRLDLNEANINPTAIKTLLASDSSLDSTTSATNITLPPYASFVAEVQ